MVTYAETRSTPATDGVAYCIDKVLPAAEGDLFDRPYPFRTPVPAPYEQAVIAEVAFSMSGSFASNAAYVVMQGDLGDGNWYDLAWCRWTGTSGTANFLLACGAYAGNSVQQTRAVGTDPGSNGSVQVPVPARLRFVGKAALGAAAGGSSPSPSPAAGQGVLVTIRYKLLGLR